MAVWADSTSSWDWNSGWEPLKELWALSLGILNVAEPSIRITPMLGHLRSGRGASQMMLVGS